MKLMLKGFMIAIVASACFAGAAEARPPNSQSVKYFDEGGNVVGQQYLLCDGRARHGGNIHTAYTITEVVVCSNPNEDPGWIVPGNIVTAYTLPSNVTIQSACLTASCEGRGVPEVQNLGRWPYSVGWQ
ncbi:hypothetical protein KR767_20030 [Luteibacter anthropi]|uniref:Uncharacterized protein n=1 Tax=Luteibacter anthropi TaxID=564369 RepID=A0A7X5UB22_9GAMM|nr:hypothetical protein [Luteibacter anthropi]NII07105.1 hypothetical protein [Luteibacter anthropi]URX62297.1 hypothetical protein KR767_20030 [Luteibacter anthropi]